MEKISCKYIHLFTACFLLMSCSGDLKESMGPAGEPGTELSITQFSDIPIPSGAKLDPTRTIVLGKSQNEWTGRLSFSNSKSLPDNYDFFISELRNFGWTEFDIIRSEIGILTYQSGDRMLITKIQEAILWGSEIEMIASPITQQQN